jgi:hypothetical protein
MFHEKLTKAMGCAQKQVFLQSEICLEVFFDTKDSGVQVSDIKYTSIDGHLRSIKIIKLSAKLPVLGGLTMHRHKKLTIFTNNLKTNRIGLTFLSYGPDLIIIQVLVFLSQQRSFIRSPI